MTTSHRGSGPPPLGIGSLVLLLLHFEDFLRLAFRCFCVLALMSSIVGAAVPAMAQQVPTENLLPRVEYSEDFRRVSWVDLGLTAGFAATLVTARVVGPPQDGPRGGVWVDEAVRDTLRSPRFSGRLRAADTSDVLLGLSMSWALFLDPLVNASWLRQSADVAAQVALLNAEALAITLGTQQLVAGIVGRERPYGRVCGTTELDERTQACEGRDRYRSYFSGHTSGPFAAAASTCAHHAFLGLSGKRAWVTCTLGFSVAAASGTLRIVADKHYLTDVLTGVGAGTLIGLAVPLWHYLVPPRRLEVGGQRIDWSVVPSAGGLSIQGVVW